MQTVLKGIIGGVTVAVIAVVAFLVVGFPGLSNPFRSETVVRDHDAVLASLEDLSEYHAATGEYQVLVDIEQRTRFVPSFLKGERTTFLAQGSVDALVDLGGLGPESVIVGENGSVTVVLPPATLDDPTVDPEASGVLDRDRGVIDRVGGMFDDSPTSDKDLYIEARARLADAATDSELRTTAEDNTASMVTELLTAAGFEQVRVLFRDSATSGAPLND